MVPRAVYEFKEVFWEEVMFKLNHEGSIELSQGSWEWWEVSSQHLGKENNMGKDPEAV